MARTEDAAVNPVVAGRDQVLDDEWMRRMNVPWRIIGTGMTDDEVTEMTARADIASVRSLPLGRRTPDPRGRGHASSRGVGRDRRRGGHQARARRLARSATGSRARNTPGWAGPAAISSPAQHSATTPRTSAKRSQSAAWRVSPLASESPSPHSQDRLFRTRATGEFFPVALWHPTPRRAPLLSLLTGSLSGISRSPAMPCRLIGFEMQVAAAMWHRLTGSSGSSSSRMEPVDSP